MKWTEMERNEKNGSTLTKHINKCTLATVKYLTIYTIYTHTHTHIYNELIVIVKRSQLASTWRHRQTKRMIALPHNKTTNKSINQTTN